jgi:hypothetical protein
VDDPIFKIRDVEISPPLILPPMADGRNEKAIDAARKHPILSSRKGRPASVSSATNRIQF